jgi:hypothetical protein
MHTPKKKKDSSTDLRGGDEPDAFFDTLLLGFGVRRRVGVERALLHHEANQSLAAVERQVVLVRHTPCFCRFVLVCFRFPWRAVLRARARA